MPHSTPSGAFTFATQPHILDPTRPPAPALEVSTEPEQRKVTLSWDVNTPDDGAPVLSHRVRTKGPQPFGTITLPVPQGSVVIPNLQVDATYEFTLDATDVCDFGTRSVRLVRLNDTTPPSMPLVASPGFDPATRVVNLSWVAATDNIQVDHYEILRNGVPIGATDATIFTDPTPTQHALLSYVVRAVDTNGNSTESAPATVQNAQLDEAVGATADGVRRDGSTVTLRWPGCGQTTSASSSTWSSATAGRSGRRPGQSTCSGISTSRPPRTSGG